MKKAIFLDRDGVINSDIGHYYIYKVDDFKINDGIIESLQKFRDAGYLLFIVTNQGGVAKGIYTMDDVNKVHTHLLKLLQQHNIEIQEIYCCPHHESVAVCSCRKPKPYFINKAIADFNIDKSKSYLIGDSKRDIEAATAAGIKGIKIDANENIGKYCQQILENKS